ncbi:MAG: hypothetical protein E2O40_04090 [Planctomycetota bacterium]|nr:MAG: hypothetical protein E2O40_04090 [Planctomycetota bacterium]
MVSPAGSVRLYDGLAELAGVSSRAIARKPVAEVAPVPALRQREPDRVELSAAACKDRQCDEDRQEIQELRSQDRKIRAHEQAHKGAGGAEAGPVSYTYTTGPDGKRYAVAGEVPIDVSPVEGDPDATIQKMQRVRAAALAPAEPSSTDRQVAAKAQQIARQAQAEKQQEPGGQIDTYA